MQLKTFLQIGIVTDNLEASIEAYKKFGLTDWVSMPFRPEQAPDFVINGHENDLSFNGAIYNGENFELELIEPVSDSVFSQWLAEHGPGIHHIAFRPAEAYDDFMADYEKTGGGTLLSGFAPDNSRGFIYLDTHKQLGFNLEIHKGAPGNPRELL